MNAVTPVPTPDLVAASIAKTDELQAMTGRSCGRCTMCCDIVGVGELKKPPDTKCKHCVPGKGCAIYDHRPNTCRGWSCLWLISKSFSDVWFPAKSRIVAYLTHDDDGSNLALMFEVDRHRPGRWLESPYFEELSRIALGARAKGIGTTVRCGRRWFILVPRHAADDDNAIVPWIGNNAEGVAAIRPGMVGPPVGDLCWVETIPPLGLVESWQDQFQQKREGEAAR